MFDDLTVIIRTRNEERYVGHCLQSCLDFLPKSKILIIDNNSTDDTIKIVNFYCHDTDLSADSNYTSLDVIDINSYTPGKALNLGVTHATTKYILFLSAHCVIKDFKRSIFFDSFENHQAIFGNQIPLYFGKRLKKRYLWSHFSDSKSAINMYSDLEDRYFMHNAFAAYKTNFLRQIPFDEQLMGKEDRYWAHKCVQSGNTYFYSPQLKCNHHFTEQGNTWRGVG